MGKSLKRSLYRKNKRYLRYIKGMTSVQSHFYISGTGSNLTHQKIDLIWISFQINLDVSAHPNLLYVAFLQITQFAAVFLFDIKNVLHLSHMYSD